MGLYVCKWYISLIQGREKILCSPLLSSGDEIFQWALRMDLKIQFKFGFSGSSPPTLVMEVEVETGDLEMGDGG